MVRRAVLAVAVTGACGTGSTSPPPGAWCDAMAITSSGAERLRQAATSQFDAAREAMARWEAWKAAPGAAPDSAGSLSGAGDRAQRYRASGLALCESELLAHRQLVALVDQSGTGTDAAMRAAKSRLSSVTCAIRGDLFDQDPRTKVTFADAWSRHRADAAAAEDDVVARCYQQLGGQRAALTLDPIVLPTD